MVFAVGAAVLHTQDTYGEGLRIPEVYHGTHLVYFDLAVQMALEHHQKKEREVRMVYLHDRKLVG